MRHKTADLAGDGLDLAVALAEGYQWWPKRTGQPEGERIVSRGRSRQTHGKLLVSPPPPGVGEPGALRMPGTPWVARGLFPPVWSPSSDWRIGGPIIERERIDLMFLPSGDTWVAAAHAWPGGLDFPSPTPLTAAMRAYVASKLGLEVDLPDGAEE